MKAKEARQRAESTAFTYADFQKDLAERLGDTGWRGSTQYLTPFGALLSPNFINNALEDGFCVQQHTNPDGLIYYIISW